jgi:hypothetical protein
MFEFLPRFYLDNADFINGAASVLTIFATASAINGYRRRQQEKIFYQWVRSIRINSDIPAGYRVSVSFNQQNGSRLVTDIITISNRTDTTLTDEDFVQPIRFKRINERALYQCLIVETSSGAHGKLCPTTDSIILEEIEIPRCSTLTIFLAHDDAVEKTLNATTKKLPDPVPRAFKKPHEFISVRLTASAISVSGLIYIVSVVDPFLQKHVSSLTSETAAFLFILCIMIFLIVITKEWLPKKIGAILRPFLRISSDEELFAESAAYLEIEKRVFNRGTLDG